MPNKLAGVVAAMRRERQEVRKKIVYFRGAIASLDHELELLDVYLKEAAHPERYAGEMEGNSGASLREAPPPTPPEIQKSVVLSTSRPVDSPSDSRIEARAWYDTLKYKLSIARPSSDELDNIRTRLTQILRDRYIKIAEYDAVMSIVSKWVRV